MYYKWFQEYVLYMYIVHELYINVIGYMLSTNWGIYVSCECKLYIVHCTLVVGYIIRGWSGGVQVTPHNTSTMTKFSSRYIMITSLSRCTWNVPIVRLLCLVFSEWKSGEMEKWKRRKMRRDETAWKWWLWYKVRRQRTARHCLQRPGGDKTCVVYSQNISQIDFKEKYKYFT